MTRYFGMTPDERKQAMDELVALVDSDPAAGVKRVIELMLERAGKATPGPYEYGSMGDYGWTVSAATYITYTPVDFMVADFGDTEQAKADTEHLATSGQPEHTVEVALMLNEAMPYLRLPRWRIYPIAMAAVRVAKSYLTGQQP